MILKGEETNILFKDNNNMYILNVMVVQPVNKGISEVTDFLDFYTYTLQNIDDNLCHPGVRVPEHNYTSPVPFPVPLPPVTTIIDPPIIFGAKYQKRLLIAYDLIQFYETIGRNVTAANIQ